MQINEHIHESKRIKERHDRLENRIKDFIPQKGDTELDMSNKKDVIFLPDQHRRYNVKSQNSMFTFEKMVQKPSPERDNAFIKSQMQ